MRPRGLKLFGLERYEITGEWRKLHNEDLNDLYCSPHIVQVIKSRRMRWAEHVARRGKGEVYTGVGGETRGKEIIGETQVQMGG